MQKCHYRQLATEVLSWIEGDDTKANYKQKLCILVSGTTSM